MVVNTRVRLARVVKGQEKNVRIDYLLSLLFFAGGISDCIVSRTTSLPIPIVDFMESG